MHPEIERLRLNLQHDTANPLAWLEFFTAACALSRATAHGHPRAFASWRRRALGRSLGLPIVALVLGISPLSPILWAIYGWQQLDLYLHLGLNRAGDEHIPWPAFPLATECTLWRAYAGAALLTVHGRPRTAFALGTATDILDGWLARRTRTTTVLGALLDAEYDGLLWVAAVHAARRNGGLTPMAARILWMRVAAATAAGFITFFTAPEPVNAGSTYAGKVAGVVQALLLWKALGPRGAEAAPRRTVFAALATFIALVAQARRFSARA